MRKRQKKSHNLHRNVMDFGILFDRGRSRKENGTTNVRWYIPSDISFDDSERSSQRVRADSEPTIKRN